MATNPRNSKAFPASKSTATSSKAIASTSKAVPSTSKAVPSTSKAVPSTSKAVPSTSKSGAPSKSKVTRPKTASKTSARPSGGRPAVTREELERLKVIPCRPPPPPPFIESCTQPGFVPSLEVDQALVFTRIDHKDESKGYIAQFKITNIFGLPVIYRVRCNDKRLVLSPCMGCVKPLNSALILVTAEPAEDDSTITFDMFKNEQLMVEACTSPGKMNAAAVYTYWARTPADKECIERYSCKSFMIWKPDLRQVSSRSAQNTYERYSDDEKVENPPVHPKVQALRDFTGLQSLTDLTGQLHDSALADTPSLLGYILIFWLLLLALIGYAIGFYFYDLDIYFGYS